MRNTMVCMAILLSPILCHAVEYGPRQVAYFKYPNRNNMMGTQTWFDEQALGEYKSVSGYFLLGCEDGGALPEVVTTGWRTVSNTMPNISSSNVGAQIDTYYYPYGGVMSLYKSVYLSRQYYAGSSVYGIQLTAGSAIRYVFIPMDTYGNCRNMVIYGGWDVKNPSSVLINGNNNKRYGEGISGSYYVKLANFKSANATDTIYYYDSIKLQHGERGVLLEGSNRIYNKITVTAVPSASLQGKIEISAADGTVGGNIVLKPTHRFVYLKNTAADKGEIHGTINVTIQLS